MFYLPRLFVYHADAEKGSQMDETFKLMERRLLKIIMNPAMIASWIFGIWLIALYDFSPLAQGYMQAKLVLVLMMSGLHGFYAAGVRRFASGENRISSKSWRILNEVPTVLMIGIVLLVVVKPF